MSGDIVARGTLDNAGEVRISGQLGEAKIALTFPLDLDRLEVTENVEDLVRRFEGVCELILDDMLRKALSGADE